MSASRRLASEARVILSRVVDWVDRVAPPLVAAYAFIVPAYRWVNFGSFAKACPGKFFFSAFLLFLEQQGAHEYCSLTKNQELTTLPSTTSDRQIARVKRNSVCKSSGVTRWRELESTYFVTSIYAQNTGYVGLFCKPFSTTFGQRIFLKPTGID